MQSLDGANALMTGASRGIGLAVATHLVRAGDRGVIAAGNPDGPAAVTELGGPDHGLGVTGRADDPAHRQQVLEQATAALGGIDVLVDNAGVDPAHGQLPDLDLDAALDEGREAQLAAGCPRNRLGVPVDIGSAVSFLCSPAASWITGRTLVTDGGSTLVAA